MIYRTAFTIAILCPTLASAATCSAPWQRTLRVGSHGEDVRALQVALNSSTSTRVAEIGAGSTGYESDVFGKATARALVKFQTEQELDPSGIFGPITRARLANLRTCKTASSSASAPTTEPVIKTQEKSLTLASLDPIARESIEKSADLLARLGYPISDFSNLGNKLIFAGPSPRAATPGASIGLRGSGFSPDASAILDGKTFRLTAISKSGGTLAIPSDMKPGLYDISVRSNGDTSVTERLAIIEATRAAPLIKTIDPTSGNVGTNITLTGSTFADVNDIDTSAGAITNVSSDGKTIRFTLVGNPSLTGSNGKLLKSLPMTIRVVNKYGVSSGVNLTIN